jgi:hypothetical protein
MDKSEAYDAAMLAGLVSSNLNHVQKNMIDPTRAVNRIDMNRFVAPLVGKGQQSQNFGGGYEEGVTPLMRKAIEDSMREASMIPEPINSNKPELIPMPEGIQYQSPAPQQVPVQSAIAQQHVIPQAAPASISHEDIQIIKSQLEKINTNLTKMAGMFGKVFASMTTQTASKNGK